MKRLRNWLTNIALRSPAVERVLTAAGHAIREAKTIRADARVEELMADALELEKAKLKSRMREMLMLREAELACKNPDAYCAMAESGKLSGAVESVTQFKERLWELELALEDRGWIRETTLATLEFSRLGVQQLIRISRIYAIKNPLIKRGAEICSLYVFGRGVEIRSEEEATNEKIQQFMEANKAELGHTGLAEKEKAIQTDGTLYFGLVTETDVKVQMIDPLEIMEVITDPDDRAKPWYFQRQWNRDDFDPVTGQVTSDPQRCWYPSLELLESNPDNQPKFIRQDPVNWDMPIMRTKIGCPANWRWGVPPVYASIDWARAYKDFLEDWATIQRALARFALMIETKGGPGAIAAYNALLNTTFADNTGTQIEKNPPPNVGSAHIAGPGTSIQPFKSNNAQTSPEQGRRMLLMVAAAQGIPETFYGDASTGSLATAVSLDRPTELKFTEIQRRWTYDLTRLLTYVVSVAAQTPGSKVREARRIAAPSDLKIIVKFPTVVEHSIKDMIGAIVDVAALGGRQGIPAGIVDRRTVAELLLAEIGVENRDELLDRMGYGEEDDYDPADDIIDQRTQAAPQSITGQDASTADNAGINDSKLKKTAEAITRLIEATRRRARKMVA